MVTILAVAVGVMCFEQSSVYYLMPFIKPSLNLNNTRVGLLVGAYCVIFAISSYAAGVLADSVGKHKMLLVSTTALLSPCAVFSGLANPFIALLAVRLLMGLLEGPMFPIAQSIIALESPAQRRGINMGIVGSLRAHA